MIARHEIRALLIWTCLASIAVVWLSWPLQPHGFVAGDQGVKLIAAKNAIAHPSRPFQVDLPTIAGHPVEFVDRFFRVHEGHAHALQSPLFPVVSAPLISAAGLRGAYVLPALGFLAMLPLAYAISNRQRNVSVAVLAVSSVLANPMFFYAFEFWEHVPAVAVLAGSTALAMRLQGAKSAMGLFAGLLAGGAVLLRPEAIWYASSLGLLLLWRRKAASYAAGVGVVLAIYAAANYVEGGTVVGYHAAANLSALSDRWLSVRLERLALWVFPTSPLFMIGVVGLVAAWADQLSGTNSARPQLIGLCAAAVIAVGAVLGSYGSDSVWRAWPLGAITLVPLRSYRALGPMVWLATATSVCVWLSSTHDGGAQWGPRVLLISTPALLVLAASAVQDAVVPGALWRPRVALVIVLVLCGLWTTRAAYVELRGWKRYYATLVHNVEVNTKPGSYILTNVWWLDQICAPIYGERTFLVAPGPSDTRRALVELQNREVREIYLAWSSEPDEPGPIDLAGSCFALDRSVSFRERGLHLALATCAE